MVVWATGSQTVPNWRPCRQNRSPTSAARTIWPTAPWIFNAVCYFAIKPFLERGSCVMSNVILYKMYYSWNCTFCLFISVELFLVCCKMQLKSFVWEKNMLKSGFPGVFSRFCFIMTLSCNNVTAELLQYLSETRSGMFYTSSVNKWWSAYAPSLFYDANCNKILLCHCISGCISLLHPVCSQAWVIVNKWTRQDKVFNIGGNEWVPFLATCWWLTWPLNLTEALA